MVTSHLRKKKIIKTIFFGTVVLFALNTGWPSGDSDSSPAQAESRAAGLLETREFFTASGEKLRLLGRGFQPGELIIVTLEIQRPEVRAWLIFNQNKVELEKEESQKPADWVRLIGWLGIDGGMEAAVYPLRLIVSSADGYFQENKFKLEIGRREFRKRKLEVAPAFIQPPAALRERIEREADLLRWVFSLRSSKWHGDGSFIQPHRGDLTAFFGDSRVYNNQVRSFHSGVDIRANLGDPVVAANSGVVVVAGNFYFAGNMVAVDHGLGLFTAYNHLSRILVKRGQKVKRGEVIGLAGSTGLSTGAHLHWSARLNEERIDPTCLLVLPFPSKN